MDNKLLLMLRLDCPIFRTELEACLASCTLACFPDPGLNNSYETFDTIASDSGEESAASLSIRSNLNKIEIREMCYA